MNDSKKTKKIGYLNPARLLTQTRQDPKVRISASPRKTTTTPPETPPPARHRGFISIYTPIDEGLFDPYFFRCQARSLALKDSVGSRRLLLRKLQTQGSRAVRACVREAPRGGQE